MRESTARKLAHKNVKAQIIERITDAFDRAKEGETTFDLEAITKIRQCILRHLYVYFVVGDKMHIDLDDLKDTTKGELLTIAQFINEC
jgi:hypothetical protein